MRKPAINPAISHVSRPSGFRAALTINVANIMIASFSRFDSPRFRSHMNSLFRLPRLLFGWMPYVMVPKAAKSNHDGQGREDTRFHFVFLFCCLFNTLLAHHE